MKKPGRPDPQRQFPYSVEESDTQKSAEQSKKKQGGSVEIWKIPPQMKRKLLPTRRPL